MNKTLTKYEVSNSIPSFASQIANREWERLKEMLTAVSDELAPTNKIHLELALIAKDLYSFYEYFPQKQATEIEELVLNMFPEGKDGYYALEIRDYKQAIYTALSRKDEKYFGIMSMLLHRLTDGKYLDYVEEANFIRVRDDLLQLFGMETTTASSLISGNVTVNFDDKDL